MTKILIGYGTTEGQTAQIADHEVVYSIISEQTEHPFSRAGVEGRFGYELRPIPNCVLHTQPN